MKCVDFVNVLVRFMNTGTDYWILSHQLVPLACIGVSQRDTLPPSIGTFLPDSGRSLLALSLPHQKLNPLESKPARISSPVCYLVVPKNRYDKIIVADKQQFDNHCVTYKKAGEEYDCSCHRCEQ